MAQKARTTPRKKPQQERSRATIETILQATAQILVKEGFDRASTNRIAQAAGVSIGSLYQYFPSKEALVAALVERHTDEMTAELARALDRVALLPLARATRVVVEIMLRAHAVDPALHKVLFEQVPRVGRLERIHEVERRIAELVRNWLELHPGEVRPGDRALQTFVAMTAVEALTHAATIHHPEKVGSAELASEITDLVVRYLRRDPWGHSP